MILSTREESRDLIPVLNQVRNLVFDLNSLPAIRSKEELESLKQIFLVLIERDFHLTVVWEESDYPVEWRNHNELTVIRIPRDDAISIFENPILLSTKYFWITENPAIQQQLAEQDCLFAYGNLTAQQIPGIHYEYLRDLLELFNPSQHTAKLLSEMIVDLKSLAPRQPLIIGIGGPDECGHAYFIEALLEALEKHDILVEGLDLTELISTEFHTRKYWRSDEIEQWMINECLLPFSEGHRIFMENPPEFMKPYETNVYPFFLAPEMVLVVWGTALFLPRLQQIMDTGILLEVSPKAATARLFGLDERENFDPDFVRKYEKNDGRLYEDYLQKYKVRDWVEQRVDFDNFHAFQLKSQGAQRL